jgi:hypothetical protein
MPHSFLATEHPHKLWGGQFWLQPAFQPALAWHEVLKRLENAA